MALPCFLRIGPYTITNSKNKVNFPKISTLQPSSPALTPDFPPLYRKLCPGTTMPHHHQISGTLLHPNRPLASLLAGRKIPNSAPATKNFVTKPEKSPCPAANPHRISKRLRKNREILGFDIQNVGFGDPFSRVRWTQNPPFRTRPNPTHVGGFKAGTRETCPPEGRRRLPGAPRSGNHSARITGRPRTRLDRAELSPAEGRRKNLKQHFAAPNRENGATCFPAPKLDTLRKTDDT